MRIFYIITFALIWMSLTSLNGLNLDAGYLLLSNFAVMICFVVSHRLGLMPKNNGFNIKIISYIPWLLKEILLSGINVSKIAWRYNLRIKPALEAIRSRQHSDLGLVLYANSITLTPGTVTINTSKDGLLVHAIDYAVLEDLKEGAMDERVLSTIAAKFDMSEPMRDSEDLRSVR